MTWKAFFSCSERATRRPYAKEEGKKRKRKVETAWNLVATSPQSQDRHNRGISCSSIEGACYPRIHNIRTCAHRDVFDRQAWDKVVRADVMCESSGGL